MTQTHWKKLTNPDYLGAYSLDEGEKRTVEIIQVSREMVAGLDGKKEECTVAFLKAEKPLILNKTNCKTITKVLGTPYIEEWSGKKITIYAEKVKAFGDVVDAIRIVPSAPTLPELLPESKAWQGAIKALQSGQWDMDKIKTQFTVSKENEERLQNDCN